MTTRGSIKANTVFHRLSSGALFVAMMAVASLGALALSVFLLSGAAKNERSGHERMQTRLLSVLQNDGLSGLSLRIDALGGAILSGRDRVDIVLWRLKGGKWALHRATSERLGAALTTPPATRNEVRDLGGRTVRLLSPNIAEASRDWLLPVADVALTLVLPEPGSEVRAARRVVLAVWLGLGLAFVVGYLLMLNHKRRYRDGLRDINTLLERFSAGDTLVRIDQHPPAPELRELARHLNEVLPRLDDLVGGLRYLSANMAHELKTPLQNIRNDLSRIRTETNKDKRADLAGDIDRTIDRANARLHMIMQLFRMEANADIAKVSGLDLSEIVENAVDDILDLLESRDRSVTLEIASGIHVKGNRYLLDLMVENLLNNCHKYAPDGAKITVFLGAETGTGRFRLSVANSGGGFPSDVRARAFERFSRARGDDSIPGTGIGLSLIRAIIERHGFEVAITPSDLIAEVVVSGPCTGPIREG